MFKVKAEIEKDNYAKFAIEPLEAGFGHTIGNSLRRVLLSSLEGSAITSIKIDGVTHQFSTIEGVSEDVIEIILNLKSLRVKVFSDKPIRLKVSVSGKKDVTGKDVDVIGDGEIANPEQLIATLTSPKSKISIEMLAEKGKGYSGADERKSGEIGFMPVDALFSPVVAVDYSVDSTRVGKRTDFDKLQLEVTTDGTISPMDAVVESAKILAGTFKQVYEPADEEVELPTASVIGDDVLKMSVEELDLPVRITNALRAIDINTVEDLITRPHSQLLKIKNLGAKSLTLIQEKLTERGLSLSEA